VLFAASHVRVRLCGLLGALALLSAAPPAQALSPSLSLGEYPVSVWSVRDGLTGSMVRALAQTEDGYLWIAGFGGVTRYDGARIVRVEVEPRLDLIGLIPGPDGTLRIVPRRGAMVCTYKGAAVPCPAGTPQLPDGARVFAVHQTASGEVLVATDLGLFRQRGTRFERDDQAQPHITEFGDLTALHVDRKGHLWVAGARGLFRQQDSRFVLVPESGAPAEMPARSFFETRAGKLWVLTERHLIQLNEALVQEKSIVVPPELGLAWSSKVIEDRDGNVWIGGQKGLARLRNGTIERPLRDTAQLFTLYEDGHGVLWLGTDHGLGRMVGDRMERIPTTGGFKPEQIRGFGEDDQGVMWVSAMGGLGSVVDGKLVPVDRAAGEEIVTADRGITRDQDGTLWLGTGSSVVGRRGGRFYSFTPALGDLRDWMFQVLPDDHGHIWFGTSRTISRAARSQMRELEASGRHSLPVVSFDMTDTRRQVAARRARNSGAWKARDGRLWFATLRGVATIDPTRIRTNPRPPSVLIERALVDGRPLIAGGTAFPPGPGNLEFHYAGVTLLEPRKALHRYRLEGFDAGWIDAGTRRVAYYTNIPPGQYRFRIQASNADGVWNEAGASLALALTPHFYETFWFYALTAIGLGGVAFALYRARLVRLRGQYLAVFAERSRVARELHDSLLQGMSAVALELANIRSALPGSAAGPAQRLEAVEDALTQSLEETRRFVWNLREQPTGAGDLGLALSRLAGRLTEGHLVACPVEVEGIAVHLSHDVQGTFFRIAQEAITNALRHAEASTIAVDLRYRTGEVELMVADDGRGFDPATAQGPESRHFGLVGMRERASRLKASLTVDSTPGAGTRVRFVFPTGPKAR
jgi:signal transduction histidine kinase/ligand-binding sensor domain-containing protein